MKKRQFLGTAGVAGLAAALPGAATAATAPAGPALLTVTGAITKPNRGKFDPARDVMMAKQQIRFEHAHAFDYAALAALPAVTIQPTLEYDARPHTLSGPLLLDVMQAAGAQLRDDTRLILRAVDGYAAAVTVAQARAQRWIVATRMDGAAMALGGLGPLWALCDAGKVPALAALPLAARFGGAPWALYHIEVSG
ncbi:molybdopterin-dependent oxidoreductase [Duganella sp. FT50W]|uniref:Molybdopterin-dependent oxidoreductase n=1 Tax=Duganella lactea TaxID=2692173 RepID=A0A6L8MCL6_9BURK|nr:molybdopterin-dependent oxidoreductase [Duganella lactea]MYM33066.1 molybdopterin-dependent oxidoreductase [Duganella lactea]MYM80447.1 molybdopterin-dependent oxidoreductase [Duganella lactea]